MAAKPDGKSPNDRFVFTRPAAERISKVVRLVEGGDRDSAGLTLRKGAVPADKDKIFRVGTFSGNWNIDTTAVVTFINAPTATVVAHNLFVDSPPLERVAVAKEGTAWYAVEFLRDEPEPFIRICEFTGAWNINSSKTVTFKYQTSTPSTVSALNLFANVPAPPSTANCAIGREGGSWFLIAAECITAT